MNAIVFDLGDTLFEYEGVPLSWETHYGDAVRSLGKSLALSLSDAHVAAACVVLRSHNTRLNPREKEISFREILDQLTHGFGAPRPPDELACARAFFAPFRQRLRAFPDARPALSRLRAKGIRIGAFTDVPYGMPRALVLDDVRRAGLADLLDVVTTSGDAAYRKPAAAALAHAARLLDRTPRDLVHVGNEQKDIAAARAVGSEAVLIDRAGNNPQWGQDHTFRSLDEL